MGEHRRSELRRHDGHDFTYLPDEIINVGEGEEKVKSLTCVKAFNSLYLA